MAYTQRVPIRFRDIDALDHVNHAVMLTYAETVRCDWFAHELGIKSMALLPFIVASAHVEYKAPIDKEAHLDVVMWTERIGSKSWTFRYDLRDGKTGHVFAEISTVQVGYDYAKAKTVVLDEALRASLEALRSPHQVTSPP